MSVRHARLVLFVLVAAVCCATAIGQEAPPANPTPRFDGVPDAGTGGIYEAVLFYLFGGGVLICALGVCITRSVVRMATFLFGTLGGVAILYFLLGAMFVGAIQLIVYVGGTLILLVFGVMLTSKSPWVRFEVRGTEVVAAAVISIILFAGLAGTLLSADWAADARPAEGAPVITIGKELLTTYLVPFEVASVVLLIVMIGAAYMVRQEGAKK
jgi:NADH-quinone oxidoreductase subunit J